MVFAFNYDKASGKFELWDSKSGTSYNNTVAAADFSSSQTLYLGTSENSSQYMDGMIGEVKVFDQVLSAVDFAAERDALAQKWVGAASGGVTIDAVYFAQTHVMKATDPYFGLVGNRNTLLKVHVVSPETPASPPVTALLTLNGQSTNLTLTGPAVLPASIPDGPGVVQHSYSNSFTTLIPGAWVKAGLSVKVTAGTNQVTINPLIGAPTKLLLTMFDVQFFSDTSGDYPAGWDSEIEAKWPVAELDLRRLRHVVFPELVIPPRYVN
ncbi:MAG: LamG domain-containing protein, partial [Verrucomicrobia bacterium]|nr:LamG domain-containing protein [Verrucomicrobiota bacterium]